jgi:hypothetical protein
MSVPERSAIIEERSRTAAAFRVAFRTPRDCFCGDAEEEKSVNRAGLA